MSPSNAGECRIPIWDSVRLWLGGELVKEFRRPATNQKLILSVFEEEGWPREIDDPLPRKPGLDAKKRLHDAIDRLNRNQKSARLRFHGNGAGTGVWWEAVALPAAKRKSGRADRSTTDRRQHGS